MTKIIRDIKRIIGRNASKKLVLVLSTTTNDKDSNTAFIGGIRDYGRFISVSLVLRSQIELIALFPELTDICSYFLIDVEKKRPFSVNNIGSKTETGKSDTVRLFSNIYPTKEDLESYGITNNVRILPWKANDSTALAAFDVIMLITGGKPGKKIAILGIGNIGFKLALMCVEAGYEIYAYSRDSHKTSFLCEAINKVKCAYTIASANSCRDISLAASNCDILVNCTNAENIVSKYHIQLMQDGSSVIDIGKDAFEHQAIEECRSREIMCYRLDITHVLYMQCRRLFEDDVRLPKLRRSGEGEVHVERGVIGLPGDKVFERFESGKVIGYIGDDYRLKVL